MMKLALWILALCSSFALSAQVKVGIDVLLEDGNDALIKDKRIGLITNQTAINCELKTTLRALKDHPKKLKLVAVFAPEHGFFGDGYAYESIEDLKLEGIPLYSLHGQNIRPTPSMLANIDVLIYDIQDIGSRSYTYVSTLFYCMEEAAKKGIEVIVLDRPNPLGGLIVDGPLLDEKWRSFVGYANIPYCHGMTIGELATFFNQEYKIGAQLTVIPMKGWKRSMTFSETGLIWVPTSPQIPEADTPFFYPTTGLIGHCSLASIGIGYTLPFKVIGAPWINAEVFAERLNAQKLPGVYFQPFYYKPFYGKFKLESCQGVRILITDHKQYYPVTTQFMILGMLKALYPTKFEEALKAMSSTPSKRDAFNKLNGSDEVLRLITEERYFAWKMREKFNKDRETFSLVRKKYLNPLYS